MLRYVMDGKKTKLKKSLLAAMIVLFAALLAINVYSIITGVHIRDIFLPGRMTSGDQSGIDNDADGKGADSSDAGKEAGNIAGSEDITAGEEMDVQESENGTAAGQEESLAGHAEGTGDVPGTGNDAGTAQKPDENAATAKEEDKTGPAKGIETSVKEDVPLELNINGLTLVKGFKIRAVPEKVPAGAGESLVWTSSDDTVVSVDNNGWIKGNKAGSAVITCAVPPGDKMDTVNVTVIDPPAKGVLGSDDAYRNKYIPRLAPRDFAVADRDISISNSRFSMNIPKGTLYPKRIESYILKWMDLVEKASGFSFYPEGKKYPKVTVSVIDSTGAMGGSEGIWVSKIDLLTDEYSQAYVYLHELSHTLDYRNTGTNLQPFTESFAIMNAYKALELYGRSDLARLYACEDFWTSEIKVSDLKNFEEYYANVEGWDGYIAGFAFSFYLKQKYGDNILTDIMKKWHSKYGENSREQPKSEFIRVIKECTSESVFTDFRAWYQKNRSAYLKWNEVDNDLYLARGINEATCLPLITPYYQGFPKYKFDNVDTLLLDFYEGIFISQFHGYSAKGIFGNCYTSTDAMVSFYDADWNFICAGTFRAGLHNIEAWGAVRMLVKGNGGYFNFEPVFSRMMKAQ